MMAINIGPFKQAVRFNSPLKKGKVLVVYIDYTRNVNRPTITISNVPFNASTYDAFTLIKVSDGLGNPSVVDPVSDDMLKYLWLWSKPPYLPAISPDFQTSGRALLFMNIDKIKAAAAPGVEEFTFRINIPAGGDDEVIAGTAYWIWSSALGATTFEENQEHPFTSGDPRPGHGGIITFPYLCADPAEQAEFMSSGDPSLNTHDEPTTTTFAANLAWNTAVVSYNGRRSFPAGANNVPGWPDDGVSGQNANLGPPDSKTESATIVVHVNLNTLAVTFGAP